MAIRTRDPSKGRPAGESYSCRRYRLARLGEPRTLYVPPVWFRILVVCLLILAATLAVLTVLVLAFQAGGQGLPGAKIAFWLAVTLFPGIVGIVFVQMKPWDWRKWIEFAVTPDGIFLPGKLGSAVFVPWQAVKAIDVEHGHGRRGEANSWVELTIEMKADDWARFGGQRRISGDGRSRRYRLSAIELSGKEIADCLTGYANGEHSSMR